MTPSELLTLIQSDTQASALFAAGNDTGCATRCCVIAPAVQVVTEYTYLGLIGWNMEIATRLMTSMRSESPNNIAVEHLDLCFRGQNVSSRISGVEIDKCEPLFSGLAQLQIAHGLISSDVTALMSLTYQQPTITADNVAATRGI